MQDLKRINPHSIPFYYKIMVPFLKQIPFKGIIGNGVVDEKIKVLWTEVIKYVASLEVKELILNYHVHTLTYVLCCSKFGDTAKYREVLGTRLTPYSHRLHLKCLGNKNKYNNSRKN
jgi:hypothetical protein